MPRVFCPECNHCLEGAPSPICPECGTEWTLTAAYRKKFREKLTARDRLVLGFYAFMFLKIAALALLLAGWRLAPWPAPLPMLKGGLSMYWVVPFSLLAAVFLWCFLDTMWTIIRGEATDLSLELLTLWERTRYRRFWMLWDVLD
jgi:hypothetical protein